MIALTRCAVNGTKPDAALLENLDLPALLEVCQSHILTACVAYALEDAGIHDAAFTQARDKSIRKNILMDSERVKILKRLEKEKIWYMPLKGAIMKDWYPRLGMRQMSDNDILCDGEARRQIHDLMLEMGFTCAHYGKGNDDAYHKEPVCSFEMHNELFLVMHSEELHAYYADVKSRLRKDEGNAYGYHFRDEDFYIYVLAHEYKHYILGGTGVRSLLDVHIMLNKFGDSLDWDYIAQELKKLGMTEYEAQCRIMAEKLFATGKPLTAEEQDELDYYITSGVYGTLGHRTKNKLEQQGSKAKYLFRRIFPTMDQIRENDAFFYRHKWLIPILLIWRPIRGLKKDSRKKLSHEFKHLMKM